MTDYELDKARVLEAYRLAELHDDVVLHAARLAREGWMPVDPVIKAARDYCLSKWNPSDKTRKLVLVGDKDKHFEIRAFLALLNVMVNGVRRS